MSVGIDNSKQFEAQYMSFMVNKIILALIEQQKEVSPTAIYRKHKIVGKERSVEVEDVPIKLKLNEESYMSIVTKL